MRSQQPQPHRSPPGKRSQYAQQQTGSQVNGQSVEPSQHHSSPVPELPPVATGQPAIMPFPVEVFPAPLQELVRQTTHYLQYRPEWIGSSLLYAASVAVGNSVGTRYNGWAQKPILYLALVGLPGTNKSSPAEYALKPLRRINADLYRSYKEQLLVYNHWVESSKKERQAQGVSGYRSPPAYQTLLVSDVTPEALVQTHQANPVGLGLFMDELAGWFQNFNRYNKGSDQEFWLSNWSFSPVSSIRKTSIPVQIDFPFISVLGTIQPGLLSELAKDRRNQNGFIDRILFAYPDDQLKPYDSSGEPEPKVVDEYWHCLEKLFMLRQELPLDENGNPQTQWLTFSAQAYELMKDWRKLNTDRINQTDNPSLKGIYAKLEAYSIRFSLLIELLNWAYNCSDRSRIQPGSVSRAIELTEYFRQNAEKVHFALSEQSAADHLPKGQQRLFNALPDALTTQQAVQIASQLLPPISERTVKSMLKEPSLFNQVAYGKYVKRQAS